MKQTSDQALTPVQKHAGGLSEGAPAEFDDTRALVQRAKTARLQTQVDSCKALEKQVFRLSELARESDLPFLVYLLDMARVAAVDERARLMRQISSLAGRD